MRVFVTGGTGALGRFLLPRLVAEGHEVIALTRAAAKTKAIEDIGARAVVADPLDAKALAAAVETAAPEVVIHQLTGLAGVTDLKDLDSAFALTNRFRTEVANNLLAAARAAGARRFLAQSFCGWPFAREGGPVKTEESPLDPNPPATFRKTLEAIRNLESAVRAASGIEALALRYGFFYGPGTAIARDGVIVEQVRKRRLPIVGGGNGVWSFIHVEDAARATVAAISRGARGIYNIVDDEPAPVSSWLPALADAVGAQPPQKVPAWLARPLVGEGGVLMMTEIRGGSNAKAKQELGWAPAYSSWSRGFVEGLG